MAREQADQPGAEQRFDLGLEDRALLGDVARREEARGMLPEQMGEAVQKTDELTEQGLVIEALGEEGDAALAEQGPPIPEASRRVVEPGTQMRVIERDIRGILGDAEELEKRVVIGQMPQRADLQAGQRGMRRIEVDRNDRGGICREVAEHVAAARCDRHHPARGINRQRREVDLRILPDLIIDEACEPEREQAIEQRLRPVRVLAMHRGIDCRQSHRSALHMSALISLVKL